MSTYVHYQSNSSVLCQILVFLIKFGEDWYNSGGMAPNFCNSRWRRPPSWLSVCMHVKCNTCVQCPITVNPTTLCVDWPDCKEMATRFLNSRWRRPPSWISENPHFKITVAFFVRFSLFLSTLVRIGPIVKKKPPTLEVQEGGIRHFEILRICISNVTAAFHVRFSLFPPHFLRIAPIVYKWQLTFEIWNSGVHQLEFRKICISNVPVALCQFVITPLIFYKDWYNSEEIATDF